MKSGETVENTMGKLHNGYFLLRKLRNPDLRNDTFFFIMKTDPGGEGCEKQRRMKHESVPNKRKSPWHVFENV